MERAGDPRVVHASSETQVAQLHALYQDEWWTRGRALEDVRTMLAGTPVVVGLVEPETDRLLAFARALTDGVYKAMVFDVIAAPDARGRGFGRRLMEELHGHPALARVRSFELYCLPKMVGFYAAWDYVEGLGDTVWMRRARLEEQS